MAWILKRLSAMQEMQVQSLNLIREAPLGLRDKRPITGFPGGSDSKESAYSVRDLGLIPGSGRSPEEVNGNPL